MLTIDPAWFAVAGFVLLAYTTEALTGFGSIVIALSLGALLLPLTQLMPILVPLSLLISVPLTARYWRTIDWRLFGLHIVPIMAAGTACGFIALPYVNQNALKMLFGLLVAGVSARELIRLYRGLASWPRSTRWRNGWIFGAGITHGLFASGGPLLVYALSGSQLERTRFRATLVALWLVLNAALSAAYVAHGALRDDWPLLLWLAPAGIAGLLVGDWLHRRIDAARFRRAVFWVLLATAIALLARSGA